MKKFLLSATLLVAFSLTSFAAEKTTNDSKESKTNTVKEKTADCTTLHLRWNDVSSDGEGGMTITYHRVDIEVCDDGSVTITGK